MSTSKSSESYPYVRHLVNAAESEIDQVVTVLLDAFEGDPFSDILLGGDLSLKPSELRANVRAALIGGQVDVISIGPKPTDIVGASIWYPPGKTALSSEEERAVGWNQFLEEIPEALRIWWLDYFLPTISQLSTEALGPDYVFNAWHLYIFGVMKEYQGRGYGRALYQLVEHQAKQDGSPMVVETTTDLDVEIYQKLGFQVCAETDVLSWVRKGLVHLMVQEMKDTKKN